MKKRKLVSLLLVGAMATATLISPIQAAEVPSPQEIAAARLQAEGLMAGDETGDLRLDKPLTRAEMACTVMLRYLERDGWTYATACEKAAELGLAPAEALTGETITRGDMAILISGSLDYLAYLQTL